MYAAITDGKEGLAAHGPRHGVVGLEVFGSAARASNH